MTNSDAPHRQRAGLARAISAALLALLPIGCGEKAEESARMARRTMTVESIPDEVRAVGQEALPDITFEDAWANVDAEGVLHSYELRGRNDAGRIREVRVSPEGEILEME